MVSSWTLAAKLGSCSVYFLGYTGYGVTQNSLCCPVSCSTRSTQACALPRAEAMLGPPLDSFGQAPALADDDKDRRDGLHRGIIFLEEPGLSIAAWRAQHSLTGGSFPTTACRIEQVSCDDDDADDA